MNLQPEYNPLVVLYRHRSLIRRFVQRDIASRYHGSVFGLAWSFFTPLVLLGIYTLVFSGVFKATWAGDTAQSTVSFAVILFTGLIAFTFVGDCLNRAPMLILANANYVKKVVFPIEILPVTAVLSALFHALVSTGALLLMLVLLRHDFSVVAWWAPVIVIPLIFYVFGICWVLASIGVFLRDLGQAINLLTTVLMFASPVFYPREALPEGFRQLLGLNPLAYTIQDLRAVLLFSGTPDPYQWAAHLLLSMVICLLGFRWFQKTRKGFADVL